MVYVSRKEYFNAAHKLYNEQWTKEKNEEIYGVCANQYWHGHNFELIVTIKGTPHPEIGFVMDMKKLGKLIRENITDKLDHRNLNIDVDFLQGIQPSCENLVIKFWEILAPLIPIYSENRATLHIIQLHETHKNFVEYRGE
jgi:6-pyruvoyltetrahydropterin/6-carboxytetrahydropterin synthase